MDVLNWHPQLAPQRNARLAAAVLCQDIVDFSGEGAPGASHIERFPRGRQSSHSLSELVPVVFLIDKALLILKKHIIPVRLLCDLPLTKAPALLF